MKELLEFLCAIRLKTLHLRERLCTSMGHGCQMAIAKFLEF